MELGALFAAYEASVAALLDLATDLGPRDLVRPTACPGWTLFDQYAHVESVDAWFLGEPLPDLDVSGYAHVRGPFAETIERLVESRRGRPFDDVLSGMRRHLDSWRSRLGGADEGLQLPSPLGLTAATRVIGIRLFDAWVHEQDVREALDRPGALDTPGAAHAVGRLVAAWPAIVASAGVPAGSVVALRVTGPSPGTALARAELHSGAPPADGTGASGSATGPVTATITATITAGTFAATRLAAGRHPLGRPYPWTGTGDLAAAGAVVRAMAITP